MNHEYDLHREDNIEMNYMYFKQKVAELQKEYDFSKIGHIDYRGENMFTRCIYCNANSMAINPKRRIYICFACGKAGKVEELDGIIIKDKKIDLQFYDEIYNELKDNYKIKTKEYALIGIKLYKLDSTFIDASLYEDEEVMYELIKNKAFYTCCDRYTELEILKNEEFQNKILELDESNICYILENELNDLDSDDVLESEQLNDEDDLPF